MITFIIAAAAALTQPAIGQAPPVQRNAPQSRAQVPSQVQALFARLDRNRDGFVARDELRGGERRRGRRLAGDTRRGERAGGQQRRMAAFDRLDSDRNGVITRAEFAAAPGLGERRGGDRVGRAPRRGGAARFDGRMFDMADANRDNRVSLQEATVAAYQRFDLADRNRDGLLTRDERQRTREQRRGQRGRS